MKQLGRSISMIVLGVSSAIACSPNSPNHNATAESPVVAVPGTIARTWNDIANNAIVTVGGNAPSAAAYLLGIVQVAVYDAVNSIDRTHVPFAADVTAPAGADAEAAVAQAAHDILVLLVPAQQASLDASLASSLDAIPDGQAKTDGIWVGQQAAAIVFQSREGDGRFASVPYTFGPADPGVFQPIPPANAPPLAPWNAHVRPLTMTAPSQFRPEPPPALTSPQWTTAFNLTKSLGQNTSTTRTAAQTEIARFWAESTPRQWNRAIRGYAAQESLNLVDTARLLAITNVAMSDSYIACWDGKYFYNFWRPITAIRAGDGDGNPNTAGDPTWTPIVGTPNHPEYPAAHGCVSTAAAQALVKLFPGGAVSFTMDSTVADTIVHHYTSFSAAGDEAGIARIYGGMHYDFSVQVGQRMGKQVANHIWDAGFFAHVE
jgi:hypothetical protein